MPAVDPVAAPVADPAGEIADELGILKLGTFNGSETQPVLAVEQGVSVRFVPPGLACVAPVTETEGAAVLGIGLNWGLTWA
jgi:hypothetical protein